MSSDAHNHDEQFEQGATVPMPAPTAWPIVTAFAIALVFTGLVTHMAVSVVGLLIGLRAAIGWWRDVLPHEKHEGVPLREPMRRIKPSPRTVTRLQAGTGDHRVHIPAEIHPYSAGLKGGLAGGAAMAIVAAIFGLISSGSLWYPINLLAAGVVPSLARATTEELHAFNGTALAAGTVMHLVVSALVGVLYAVLLPMFPKRAGIWSGLVTPVMWSALIYATLDVINPTMAARIDWKWFVASQVAYGLVAAYVVAKGTKIETMQSWSIAARAGLEATMDHGDEEKKS
jgi:hypothetical protein